MVHIKSFILLFTFILAFSCGAEDTPIDSGSVEQMVKRINERHDDFFRYHRELEERWDKRRGSADERKRREQAHADSLEKARTDYVRSKRERPSDEALRVKWEAAQKDRAAEHEMLRRRYVEKRDRVEQYLKKGRQIPEMKEFDLEED